MANPETPAVSGVPRTPGGDPKGTERKELREGVRAIVGPAVKNGQGEPRYTLYLGIPHITPVIGPFRRGRWGPGVWERDARSEEYLAANTARDAFRYEHHTNADGEPTHYRMFEVDRGTEGDLFAIDVTSAGLPEDHKIVLDVNQRGPAPTTVLSYEGHELDGKRTARTSDNLGSSWLARDIDGRLIEDPASIEPGTELSLEATRKIFDFVHGQGEFADLTQ